MVLERSVRLENLNHWWIFSYFCFTCGVHCETWIEQESSSSLQTILNVTPTDARWFTWQCCRQLCHQPILDWNSASAGNEIWVDFKLCLSKVVGKVEFVIQIPDLCFSFEILLLIFDPRKDVSGLKLKVSDSLNTSSRFTSRVLKWLISWCNVHTDWAHKISLQTCWTSTWWKSVGCGSKFRCFCWVRSR